MEDLRRHRTYQGRSVRDLLRALRNKVISILFHVELVTELSILL